MSTSTVRARPVHPLTRATDTVTVVPSEDSHQSEYIAPCDARRGQTPPPSPSPWPWPPHSY